MSAAFFISSEKNQNYPTTNLQCSLLQARLEDSVTA